jgi:hypothetical protein
MRLVLPAGTLSRALGAPVDVLGSLRRAGVGGALLRRVVESPASWSLDMPVVQPGGGPGSAVAEVILG